MRQHEKEQNNKPLHIFIQNELINNFLCQSGIIIIVSECSLHVMYLVFFYLMNLAKEISALSL